MRTGRTNSITKGREVATLKKVGSEELQFGRERDYGHCGEGAMVSGKDERQTSTQGRKWGKLIPIKIGLECEKGHIL